MAANNKCSDCGNEREPTYQVDSCCKSCRSLRNKAKRDAAMVAKGKRPYGSGRDPNCSFCGKVREPEYQTSSRCRSCMSAFRKERVLKKRAALGKPPIGSGRGPLCSSCNAVKENRASGYCNTCKRKAANELYAKKRQSPEYVEKYKEKVRTRYNQDPLFKLKKIVQHTTIKHIDAGILIRQPCEVCGEIIVDAHHDDYMKPLDVRWLCRHHHREHHENERKKLKGVII